MVGAGGKVSPDSSSTHTPLTNPIAARTSIYTKQMLPAVPNNNTSTNSLLMKQKQQAVNGASTKNNGTQIKANWELSNLDETVTIVKTSVAWKSLTTPACLPLTTDFFPNRETWNKKFSCSSAYSLLLDEIREQYGYTNYQYHNKITMAQVFNELVGHRLAMGFQIVVPKNTFTYSSDSAGGSAQTAANPNQGSFKDNAGLIMPASTVVVVPTNSVMTNSLTAYFISDISSSYSVIARTQASSIRGYFKVN
jgi:hypothetical protein